MKATVVWLILLASAAVWIVDLRRRLQASELRGNMYRDISARLDRRLAEMTAVQELPES
jgi:hypothetical protein